ncbi:substrate-binding domain-containing protein, partial [Enterococcus faecalis]|uniref:substrate-binding domain-containing protein n=1 Tax=Enterococcus faecalis TaxID=1351 RepID=UPI003D6C1433
ALNKPIIYPVGIVAASNNQKSPDAFLNFLQSHQCRKYFENIGFKLTKYVGKWMFDQFFYLFSQQ